MLQVELVINESFHNPFAFFGLKDESQQVQKAQLLKYLAIHC